MLSLRLAFAAIALMALLTASTGVLAIVEIEGDEPQLSIDLTLGGDGPYWEAVANGARDSAAHRGVELAIRDDIEPSGRALLSIVGAEETASCGGDVGMAPPMFHVGVANYAAGRLCAHYAAKNVPTGRGILLITDGAAQSPAEARLQGFLDTTRYYDDDDRSRHPWTVAIVAIAHGSGNDQRELAAAIKKHGEAALIIDFTGRPVAELQNSSVDRGRNAMPRLLTFDQSQAALAAIETGDVAAVVTHDPYQCGFQAVDRLIMFHRSDLLGRPAAGKGFIHVPAQLVERGNLAEFRSSLKLAAGAAP